MASRIITNEVLEAFLNCRYKGYLKHQGRQGVRTDYEAVANELRNNLRLRVIDRIASEPTGSEVVGNGSLTTLMLKHGPSFIRDAILEDELLSIRFDGLKKVKGVSPLGDYHYIPVLFHSAGKVRWQQRLLLELYGLFLSRIQGKAPGIGIIYYGRECRATTIRFSSDLRQAERLLRDVQQLLKTEAPRLVLNDHCQVCEFRQRCHEQATKEENLSLLNGLGEKEVSRYARKGILTLTQLAHTFRPRRKGKRVVRPTNHRYHALQALAIRDQRVYLLGIPDIPAAAVRIYLDLEGLPD